MIFNFFHNSTPQDAAAATKAKKEKASYSSIMFFGEYNCLGFLHDFLAGSFGGILAPNIIGPIVDHVNFNPTIIDCISGEDVTTADYRVPFGIANCCFFFMAAFVYFFVDIEVEKTDTKLPFRQEFGWVSEFDVLPSKFTGI